ncbi:hypothetical protein PAHAL_9G346000 [Panicum hallii]|uniref:Uncharacterized protein n=1 Tax=Panicum hallii TaxID=206008 RepID=A0A2S3IMR3_9POAL|nr:hypothetical protein PAHAL_9G346000 [Panicum hallii]
MRSTAIAAPPPLASHLADPAPPGEPLLLPHLLRCLHILLVLFLFLGSRIQSPPQACLMRQGGTCGACLRRRPIPPAEFVSLGGSLQQLPSQAGIMAGTLNLNMMQNLFRRGMKFQQTTRMMINYRVLILMIY